MKSCGSLVNENVETANEAAGAAGDGAVGLPTLPPVIYHGRFGTAPFQTIYHQNLYSHWAWVTALEWHLLASFLVLALSRSQSPRQWRPLRTSHVTGASRGH